MMAEMNPHAATMRFEIVDQVEALAQACREGCALLHSDKISQELEQLFSKEDTIQQTNKVTQK